MFNKSWILTLILFLVSPVYADIIRTTETVTSADTTTWISVPGTGVVRTKSISTKNLDSSESLGVMYQADTGNTTSLKIEVENGAYPPVTEGAYDEFYVTNDTVNAAYTDTYWMMATIDSVMFPYIRFKITGTGSNSNATRIRMKVSK